MTPPHPRGLLLALNIAKTTAPQFVVIMGLSSNIDRHSEPFRSIGNLRHLAEPVIHAPIISD
jgi:hypothetical protein